VIDSRLFDWYGIDTNKNLGLKTFCPRPYDTVLIDKQGSCYLCECTAWLPQSAGNLHIQSLEDIVNSKIARELQSSIADGSYRYCNNQQCSHLLVHQSKKLDWKKTMHSRQIKNIRLAIDDSCNLKCPSCRKTLIFDKKGKNYNSKILLADKINSWLQTVNHLIKIHIGSDGDPFASQVYKYFMNNTPKKNNIKYSILTNALMFKKFYKHIPYVIQNLIELGVSIDGASQETYEKLRLGGKWDNINENLECIAELKKKYNFKFRFHFVVQKENYHEMEDIVLLGKKYNADRVWLSRIQNWNTFKNFEEHNIFSTAHPLHSDYQKQLRKLELLKKTMNSDILQEETLSQLH
jgi:MoaA/NifB/PqqE/SkfB family radical SAM enzyme